MTDLPRRLLQLGYTQLFERLDDDELRALWAEAGVPSELRALALDQRADLEARFLAAEIVLSRGPDMFSADERSELGSLYAQALRSQLPGVANEWAFPFGSLGLAGEHVVGLGTAAVPALATLLDDTTPLRYEGSKDAMVAESYRYRVKDLAAQLVAAILGLPYPRNPEPPARDAVIVDLAGRLR